MALDKNKRVLLVSGGLATMMIGVDQSVANIILADIRYAFEDQPLTTIAWVISGYALTRSGFLLIGGASADQYGHRRTFLVGLAVFTASSIAAAAAPTMPLMILARLTQGLGTAVLGPVALTLIVGAFPKAKRSSAMGIWGACSAASVAIGPLAGGLLSWQLSWRFAFLINVPIAAYIWLSLRRDQESEAPLTSRQRPDYHSALLVTVGSLLVAGGVMRESWRAADIALFLVSIGCAAVLLTLAAWRLSSGRGWLIPRVILRSRPLALANVATALYGGCFYILYAFGVLHLAEVWGLNVLEIAVALSPLPVLVSVTSVLAGRLSDRIGHRRVLLPGTAGLVVGFFSLLLLDDHRNWVLWFASISLVAIAVGAVQPILAAAAIQGVNAASLGAASGLNQMARHLGGALWLGGAFVALATAGPSTVDRSYRAGWWLAILLAALVGAVVWRSHHSSAND